MGGAVGRGSGGAVQDRQVWVAVAMHATSGVGLDRAG
jgi:hypothetical protein